MKTIILFFVLIILATAIPCHAELPEWKTGGRAVLHETENYYILEASSFYKGLSIVLLKQRSDQKQIEAFSIEVREYFDPKEIEAIWFDYPAVDFPTGDAYASANFQNGLVTKMIGTSPHKEHLLTSESFTPEGSVRSWFADRSYTWRCDLVCVDGNWSFHHIHYPRGGRVWPVEAVNDSVYAVSDPTVAQLTFSIVDGGKRLIQEGGEGGRISYSVFPNRKGSAASGYTIAENRIVEKPGRVQWILYVNLAERFELEELRRIAEVIMYFEGRQVFVSAEQRRRSWYLYWTDNEKTFADTVLTDPMIKFYYPGYSPALDDPPYGTAKYSQVKIPIRRTLEVSIQGMTCSEIEPLKADSLRAEGAIDSWFSDATLIRYELVQKDTSYTMVIRYGDGKTVESKPLRQIARNVWRWDSEFNTYSEFTVSPDRSTLQIRGAWNGVEHDNAKRLL